MPIPVQFSHISLLSVAFVFAGLGMVVDISLYESTAGLSGLFAALLAIPAYYAVIRWLGAKRALFFITILSLYAITIETIALYTGFPYGSFEYSNYLGYKLFGLTPWSLFFSWTPLLLTSYYVTMRLANDHTLPRKLLFMIFSLLLLDLVLDPAAVALGLWQYANPSFYYGVDLQNFAGWMFSGLIGSLLMFTVLRYLFNYEDSEGLPSYVMLTTYLTVCLWSSALLGLGSYFPAILGFIECLSLGYFLVSDPMYTKESIDIKEEK